MSFCGTSRDSPSNNVPFPYSRKIKTIRKKASPISGHLDNQRRGRSFLQLTIANEGLRSSFVF
jgi:hypothetical protein